MWAGSRDRVGAPSSFLSDEPNSFRVLASQSWFELFQLAKPGYSCGHAEKEGSYGHEQGAYHCSRSGGCADHSLVHAASVASHGRAYCNNAPSHGASAVPIAAVWAH